MGGLVLRLRPNEKFLVNGVLLENGDRRTRLCVKSQDAKILRFRDALPPEEANTPSKRLYYIAQLIVAGQADPVEAIPQLLDGLEHLKAALAGEPACQDVDEAIVHANEERFYHVMRSLHRIFPHEAELLATELRPTDSEDSAA